MRTNGLVTLVVLAALTGCSEAPPARNGGGGGSGGAGGSGGGAAGSGGGAGGAGGSGPAAELRINEVSCQGSDWVELFNLGATPADAGGFLLTDDPAGETHLQAVAAGTTIPANGFAVVQLLDFGLSCGTDDLFLRTPAGELADQLLLPALLGGTTVGRLPDGTGAFEATLPTPGLPNRRPVAGEVKLNEIDCRGREWVELKNLGDIGVDLSGYSLTGEGAASSASYTFPAGTELSPAGLEVIEALTATEPGFTFGISCSSETVILRDATGGEVDRVQLAGVPVAATWGRLPDGLGAFAATLPTKGATNLPFEDLAAALYDPFGGVPTIDLYLDAAARTRLANDPYGKVEGGFEFTGTDGVRTQRQAVGVRLKGRWGSFRNLDQKAGFKVDFNFLDGSGSFQGLRKLTLNNMVQDPSFIREWLAYTIFRAAGVPAPRVGYVWVRLDEQDLGLYLNLETPDAPFFARHFDTTGHVYEGQYGQDFFDGTAFDFEVDQGDPLVRTDLETLIDRVNRPVAGFEGSVAPLLALEEILRMMAAEIFIGHWDGYAPTRNNYYLHADAAGIFSLLPWGVDQTFDAWLGTYEGQGLLLQGCVSDRRCKARYEAAIGAVLASVDVPALVADLRRLAVNLAPRISRDPRKEVDLGTVEWVQDHTVEYLTQRKPALQAQVDCAQDPTADTDGDGFQCDLDCDEGDPLTHRGADDLCGDLVDQDCNGRPDDGESCPDCTQVLRGDHAYLFCWRTRAWADAQSACQLEGAELVMVGDAQENGWVRSQAESRLGNDYWLGLTDLAREGSFVWVDGTPLTFAPWSPGEPNNAGEEDCGQVWVRDGSWNDLPCDWGIGVVCEEACAPGEDRDADGALRCGTDCDDSDSLTYPGAPELCGDGLDQDCDGVADDGC